MSTTPIRIDPRIRERLIAVRREAGRRRLRILLVGCSVISAAGLAFLVINSPLVDIDAVEVAGTQRVSADQVREAARVDMHDPLLLLDDGAVTRRIEALPWVANASVHRDWPGTVRIAITEHYAVAYVRAGDKVLLVAPTGRVVARVNTAPSGVIEVRGLRRPPLEGQLLSPPEAAGVVAQLPLELAERVEAIDLASGLALDLKGGGELRLGDAKDIDAKVAATLAVLAHLGPKPFTYIDVSTPQRPIHRD